MSNRTKTRIGIVVPFTGLLLHGLQYCKDTMEV